MTDKTAGDTTIRALDILQKRINQLEGDNQRLRQQRDAANAQLDFILENMKCTKQS